LALDLIRFLLAARPTPEFLHLIAERIAARCRGRAAPGLAGCRLGLRPPGLLPRLWPRRLGRPWGGLRLRLFLGAGQLPDHPDYQERDPDDAPDDVADVGQNQC